MTLELPDNPRFLITRLSAIGDCILTLPLACAVRERWPRARIGWVVQGGGAQLLRGHECIDELFVVGRGWLRSPRKLLALRRQLRAFAPHAVLDAQSLTKSAAAGWLSGARLRIGFAPPQGRELALWLNKQRVRTAREHIVEKHLELLVPLGVTAPAVRFAVPVDPQATENMEQWLAEHDFAGRFVVINTGAGWDSKLWPPERYAQVATRLGQEPGVKSLVVWAGEREENWARLIAAASGGHATVAPETRLPELAAVLRKATLFIGSDTGPLHLAAAVGTPCLGLYGPTRPADCGPYGAEHVALQTYLQQGTSRQRRGNDNSAMRAITVAEAISACGEMLSRLEKQSAAA